MSIIPKDTIHVIAESIGISNLPDDVAAALAPDVEYRMREIMQVLLSLNHFKPTLPLRYLEGLLVVETRAMLGFCRTRCCGKLLVIAKWRVRMLSSNILEKILLKFMGGMLFGSSTVANFVAFNRSRAFERSPNFFSWRIS